jgi:hypothetical protein
MRGVVRASLIPFVAVLLLAAFLGGAGIPLPPLPVVLILAAVIAWIVPRKRTRDLDDD